MPNFDFAFPEKTFQISRRQLVFAFAQCNRALIIFAQTDFLYEISIDTQRQFRRLMHKGRVIISYFHMKEDPMDQLK